MWEFNLKLLSSVSPEHSRDHKDANAATHPTTGPPWSRLYTCLGFSRYLNFLSTLKGDGDQRMMHPQSLFIV